MITCADCNSLILKQDNLKTDVFIELGDCIRITLAAKGPNLCCGCVIERVKKLAVNGNTTKE